VSSKASSEFDLSGTQDPFPEPDENKSIEDDEELGERFVKPPWEKTSGNPVPISRIFKAFSGHILKYKTTLLRALFALFVAAGMVSMIPLATKFVIDYLIPSRNYLLLGCRGECRRPLLDFVGGLGDCGEEEYRNYQKK